MDTKFSCDDCREPFGLSDSCTFPYARVDGVVRAREGMYEKGKTFTCAINASGERCYDCGIVVGKIHHFGCEIEKCPVCSEAMATCECEVERLQAIS